MRVKKKYQLGDYKLIQSQILQTNIARTVWQTVRRFTNEILGFKGWERQIYHLAPSCQIVMLETNITWQKKFTPMQVLQRNLQFSLTMKY